MQHARDKRAGLNTAGYITGYRGSPIAGIEGQCKRAQTELEEANILFQPALNEDLGATALWGTQQAELRGEGRYDGVFGIWYGKGPGVDRSGDVFRHANHAGASAQGGVLALMGDDHMCESSTSAHQSEFAFLDAMMPVLNPAGVQEILDYGLLGIALSRYAGVWVGLKCVKDNIESTAAVDGTLDRVTITLPDDFIMPEGGLNIRLGDTPLAKEARLHTHKRDAILAFARTNRLDRMVMRGGPEPKIGIITTGKSYLDVRQALDELGIDELRAGDLGIRLYKTGLVWPLEPGGVDEFADGLDLIIVVEEKRSLIETQIKEQLYGCDDAPAVIGKRDEHDAPLFPACGALEPTPIAVAIGTRILASQSDKDLAVRVQRLQKVLVARAEQAGDLAQRMPWFCAGCPHNRSTTLPSGARAYAGIGCHYMAQWMDRATQGFTHMGGEGANWIGEAPFSKRRHVFQNLGDGTYDHSGSLAIRAAVASGVNITYKLLYNDAVAMTGGQPLDSGVTVADIAHQVTAEGVKRVAVVTDEPQKYGRSAGLPRLTRVYHRDALDEVQSELSEIDGTTVLIYDQTCAAEKRRRRKRGLMPDPAVRTVINEAVCEGCGDCSTQSNCVAIIPTETELGRKRAIDQSACNKDFSCLNGFCPSFVTIHGARLKKPAAATQVDEATEALFAALPSPEHAPLKSPRSVVFTGIGGTGVVTVSAILGMAAHIAGKGFGSIDMTGLAQKGGSVVVHTRLAEKADDIHAVRAGVEGADLILGADLVVTASQKVVELIRPEHTDVIVSTSDLPTGQFVQDRDFVLPNDEMRNVLEVRTGPGKATFFDAQHFAHRLLGDTIGANLMLLGAAYQMGLIPIDAEAILHAIEINGVMTAANRAAFNFGRLGVHDRSALERAAGMTPSSVASKMTDETFIQARIADLTAYQNAAYAKRYADKVSWIAEIEKTRAPGLTGLAQAVMQNYFKLLAYKDEYEVARLFTDGGFMRQLARQFEPGGVIKYHLAPPILARRDPHTGLPRKRAFGPWLRHGLKLLTRLKVLRGTALDPFGYTQDRRDEHQLITDYEALLDEIAAALTPNNHDQAVKLAGLPRMIKGYGHIKRKAIVEARAHQAELLSVFHANTQHRTPPLSPDKAA